MLTYPYFQRAYRASWHTVVGDLRVLPDVWSPQLNNRRDVLVHLPPSYGQSSWHYPVLYMHDGQNLFDRATSFLGVEWGVDETMHALSPKGREAIVVGIPNMGAERLAEYNPFPGRWPGRGEAYIYFIAETLKPLIDHEFRTLPDRDHTGLCGSSLGGLISLYGFFRRPDVFGLCGAMSPSLWASIYTYTHQRPYVGGRIYLDNGTREPSARAMRDLLLAKGYRLRQTLRYRAARGHHHTEAAWAKRLPGALRFLLPRRSHARRVH